MGVGFSQCLELIDIDNTHYWWDMDGEWVEIFLALPDSIHFTASNFVLSFFHCPVNKNYEYQKHN